MMFLQIMIVVAVTSQIFVCGGEVDSKILANGEVYDPQVGIGVVIINFTITDISVIINIFTRTTVGPQSPT